MTLRVDDADGARRNSLALRQADALIPSTSSMLGAGQRGFNPYANQTFDLLLHRHRRPHSAVPA
ncbi:MAG: hypothetical protein QNJ01_09065, partial [Desulfobacterales bacterium]|nr:hypothetical protein [Desulfobacterales bacterium]